MLIGELSARTGISVRMLRHYEAKGLLPPADRTTGGYRCYTVDDARRVLSIEGLRSLGLSLAQVRDALRAGTDSREILSLLAGESRARMRREQELLERLEAVRESGPAQWDDVLEAVAVLRSLQSRSSHERFHTALSAAGHLPARAVVSAIAAEQETNALGALTWSLKQMDNDALPALRAAMSTADAPSRRRLIEAAAALEAGAASDVLEAGLKDADDRVRGVAAVALGRTGSPAACRELIDMIAAGRNDVDAAESLGVIVARDGHRDCTSASDSASDSARKAARDDGASGPHDTHAGREAHSAQSMEQQVVARLMSAARRTGPQALCRAAQALAEIPGGSSAAALRDLSLHDDPAVARVASYVQSLRPA